jgi:hypothetical protein
VRREPLLQAVRERAIELYRDDECSASGELGSEDACARADLDDAVTRVEVHAVDEPGGDPATCEKVLPERLPGHG